MYYLIPAIIVVGYFLHLMRIKQTNKIIKLSLYRPNTNSSLIIEVNPMENDELHNFIIENYPGWVPCENVVYVKPPWIN